ncbi:hypothetical protein [Pseudomonas lurida]|uniref:hypothetical protein n=1 Tax=Pseudomonas lurida TaxID=244566 RepID=UPI000BF36A87|nr:hypothetical protein [Pseudomonas lurida]
MSTARKKIIARVFEVIIFLFFMFIVVMFLTGVAIDDFRLVEMKHDSGTLLVMVWQTLVVAAAFLWFWRFHKQ